MRCEPVSIRARWRICEYSRQVDGGHWDPWSRPEKTIRVCLLKVLKRFVSRLPWRFMSSCYKYGTCRCQCHFHKNVNRGPTNFQILALLGLRTGTICSCPQPQQVPLLVLGFSLVCYKWLFSPSIQFDPPSDLLRGLTIYSAFEWIPIVLFLQSTPASQQPLLLCGLSSTTGMHAFYHGRDTNQAQSCIIQCNGSEQYDHNTSSPYFQTFSCNLEALQKLFHFSALHKFAVIVIHGGRHPFK